MILGKITQTLLCQHLFLLAVDGNVTCFDPFPWVILRRTRILVLVLELRHRSIRIHVVCMNFYTNKYTLIKMWFKYSLKFYIKRKKINIKIRIKISN
jgi:hypothetical protein